MHCHQCEQTVKGRGCTQVGVCEKTEDLQSLQDTLIIGIRGLSAYAYAARELGGEDQEVNRFVEEALFATGTNVNFDSNRYLALLLKCGEMNLRMMEIFDKARVKRFGAPVPTQVSTGTKAGHCILVSGHDLLDLYELLKQTEGKGINVYTHGEMLPAHSYPELKKFKHLVANYGGAWQDQKVEFARFPGAIVATTNCVLLPEASYKDRIFTTGITGLPGVTHIEGRNFKSVIEKAKSLPALTEEPGKNLTTGFHYTAVLGIADKLIDLIKRGKIRHVFLVGGCDGPGRSRSYYTEFVQKVPKDCIVLTLACGKFRFNGLEMGDIEGVPRLIDLGQCNDAYSAIQIAVALAGVFKVGVNELPLSLVLSWFEQKAVTILLTLLHLGIKGIRIGPTAPAFISPNVLNILVEKFDLKLITTADKDLKAILG